MKTTRRTYYYAYVDYWWGEACAVHKDRQPAPFAHWRRVSVREYRALKREGFRVRVGRALAPPRPARRG